MNQPPKTIIFYYSLEGTTRQLAQAMAAACGAELREVRPAREIPRQGFGKFFLGGMQALFKQRPELLPLDIDLASYQLIVLGTPTWASHLSPPMRSWLSRSKLSGKKVALFATSQGGKTTGVMQDLRALLPGCQIVGEQSFTVRTPGQTAEQEASAAAWLQQLLRD